MISTKFLNKVMANNELIQSDKLLLIFLYSNKKENTNIITGYGIGHIADLLSTSNPNIIRSLKRLEKLNYLIKINRIVNGKKAFSSNNYILAPIKDDFSLDTDFIRDLKTNIEFISDDTEEINIVKRKYNKEYVCY